ncbi:MAG TPA: hypothetical protein VMD02_00620 [Candidatus Omnitrophota bacterium]|nr:hypothetical protein [Candidatus Omnitrophota bacterium]
MLNMVLRLLLATAGASILLAFIFKEMKVERKEKIDWDGMAERALIVVLFSAGRNWVWLILPVIIARISYYLFVHWKPYLIEEGEPAVDFQRAVFKTETMLSLVASPALGLLACMIL